MKHLKMFGLAAMAAMALMGLVAASASATALYSGATKQAVGAEIKSSLTTGGTASLTTTEGTELDTCTISEVNGTISNAGGASATVSGNVTKLHWTNCTVTTHTLALGTLEIHWTSGVNGTLTGSGFEVTTNTKLFGSCVFTLGTGTTLGTLTGSTTGDAVMDINAVATRKSGLCPSTAKWVANYTVTTPTPLHVTAS